MPNGGRALTVGPEESRAQPQAVLQRHRLATTVADDPYAAMVELARQNGSFAAVVLCLNGLYREELPLIPAIKQRWPHIEIYLTHIDGRQAALAEALRLGADGLLTDDDFQRVAPQAPAVRKNATVTPAVTHRPKPASPENGSAYPHRPAARTLLPLPGSRSPLPDPHETQDDNGNDPDLHDATDGSSDPVLTAGELRALLAEPQQQPPEPDR